MGKSQKYTFTATPNVLAGATEDMYNDSALPRDWVNCAAQELLLNAYGSTWQTRTSAEIAQCIQTSECILMAIAAHEKEKARKPVIWMPGAAQA